jgi:demethylmenaquinone methyltransferase/2-methoxy-6-polyprenyl-1,4-benzoquinol methylase
VDITMAMLREGQRAVAAKPLPVGVELVCGSGMQMPFQSGAFDLITCGLGMHHMQVPTTLAQLRRTLKADGRLLVVAVGAPRLWRWPPVTFLLRLFTFAFFWFKDKKPRAWAESEAFSSVFSPLEWHSHLQEAGFANIQIETLLIGRRFWYPNGIVITAQKGA